MNFGADRNKRQSEVRIELTSLVDVVFLLLIFFMVTTTFASTAGLDVDLPEAGNATKASSIQPVVIALDAEGRFAVDGRQLSDVDALARAMADAASEGTDRPVVIKADTKVHHGSVVQAMQAARVAGFKKVGIATRPEKARPQ